MVVGVNHGVWRLRHRGASLSMGVGGGFVACVFLCRGNTQREAETVGVGAHQRGELAM